MLNINGRIAPTEDSMRTKDFEVVIGADGSVKRRGEYGNAHIHCLKQTEHDLKKQAGAVLDAARNENRKTTADEDKVFAACTRELEGISQALVICEREKEIDRASGSVDPVNAQLIKPARGRKFAEMFPSIPLSLGGFASSEEFLSVLHSGLADPRLIPAYAPQTLRATATGAVPSEGGFSVPTEVFARWLDSSLENEIVRSRADVRPMTTSEGVAPGWDEGDHTSNLYGGFAGAWLPEDGSMTVQTPRMRMIRLKARKLGVLTSASNELIADGLGFDEQLGVAISKALGWFLDLAFLTGTGAPQPLGVLDAPCTIIVAKETLQVAATITYTNVCKMFARLAPASIPNAVWVCNSTAIPQLLQLSHPVGTGGSAIPAMSESNGTWRLLTRPVVFTEKVPTLGQKGDIFLADFQQYAIGMRADFSLAKSQHIGFASDSTYYRGIIRVDGMPKLTAPITPLHGDTLSPFVVLAERS
jgi:HK97 family phage major capsid protein